MKTLKPEQLKSICEYYEIAKNDLSLEGYEYEIIDFFWNDFYLCVVTSGHHKGYDIHSIESVFFIDDDSNEYSCPPIIEAPIKELIMEQYGLKEEGFEPITFADHYGSRRV